MMDSQRIRFHEDGLMGNAWPIYVRIENVKLLGHGRNFSLRSALIICLSPVVCNTMNEVAFTEFVNEYWNSQELYWRKRNT